MTLAGAFDQFLQKLELTAAEHSAASDQHVHLRERLAQRLSVDPNHQSFLTGSYARRTAIRPLEDIDFFCVLVRPASFNPAASPGPTVGLIKRALEAIYAEKIATRGNRAVNIAFTGTGIAYDVVPAVAEGGSFWIPDRASNCWIRSNPKIHAERSTSANDRTSGRLKPLTKAVKHWNRQGPQLRSFLLEVMAWDVLVSKPTSDVTGFEQLLRGLSTRILRATPEPAGLGPNLDADLDSTERYRAATALSNAAEEVRRASEEDRSGRTAAANNRMAALLGQPYPGGR